MTAIEIIQYMRNNQLQFYMLDALLFNDLDFIFTPIRGPRIEVTNKYDISILDEDDVNVMSSDYQLPSMHIPEEVLNFKNWNKYIYQPQHIVGYMVRCQNYVFGELFHDRNGERGATKVIESAFENFIEYAKIKDIHTLKSILKKAVSNREKLPKKYLFIEKNYSVPEWIFTKSFIESAKKTEEDPGEIASMYRIRMRRNENICYANRYISINNQITVEQDQETLGVSSIYFEQEFVPIMDVVTPLDKPISIIDSKDTIANILYAIAIQIKATTLYIATGYAYDTGLRLIETAASATRFQRPNSNVELIVGDLQKYKEGVKQEAANRATAERLNWIRLSHLVQKLYTCPNRFYHGKFYYISNGVISYIIMGSSNITVPAYKKNKELDVIYRFERVQGGEIPELEKEFLDWYDALKNECVELPILQEELFASNTKSDEKGNCSGQSLYKSLTNEEERRRYDYLSSYSPGKIEENIFKNPRNYKAFKNYVAFIYPVYGITILECFMYGNSSYIFSTTNIERIKKELTNKGKEQVRRLDIYITDIQHNENYEDDVRNIFESNII